MTILRGLGSAVAFMYTGWADRSWIGKAGLLFTWAVTLVTVACIIGQFAGWIRLG